MPRKETSLRGNVAVDDELGVRIVRVHPVPAAAPAEEFEAFARRQTDTASHENWHCDLYVTTQPAAKKTGSTATLGEHTGALAVLWNVPRLAACALPPEVTAARLSSLAARTGLAPGDARQAGLGIFYNSTLLSDPAVARRSATEKLALQQAIDGLGNAFWAPSAAARQRNLLDWQAHVAAHGRPSPIPQPSFEDGRAGASPPPRPGAVASRPPSPAPWL